MAEPQIEFAFPVHWPAARPRSRGYRDSLFRQDGRRLTFDQAVRRLREQVNLVTRTGQDWCVREQTLSTNYELRVDGRPRRDRREPTDPAVAFFFELDGRPHVLACDRWNTVADNIAAIAAHIEALRGQERWGVADLQQAFAGHVALPVASSSGERWWQILKIHPGASCTEIDTAWREQMRTAHPDAGGSDAAAARLNQAREEGKQANG